MGNKLSTSIPWPAEAERLLINLYNQGLLLRVISEQINAAKILNHKGAPFLTSKSSCIGKAARLGIQRDFNVAHTLHRTVATNTIKSAMSRQARDIPILEELKVNGCHFINGDPSSNSSTICNEKVYKNNWCKAHYSIVYVPRIKKEGEV